MKFVYIVCLFLASLPFMTAQTPEEICSWLPDVEKWRKPTAKEVFDPDHLFDRINGAAPLFIENGFREMTACDYTKEEDYITVQVYRHATPEDAFGMYASERSSDLTFYKIGGEAHGNQNSMFFFAGRLYVKIRSNSSDNDAGNAIRQIAETIAEKAAPNVDYPAMMKVFPEENKIPHTEAYITSNYIGHEFLNKVYVCQYKQQGLIYQLFVMDAGSDKAAKDILDKYFTFTKQPLDFREGLLLINDRYNGEIPCLWKGRYLIGIYNENGETIPAAETKLQISGLN